MEEDEDYNKYPLPHNGIHTVREDSQESSDNEDSIDHIEQRIKKLERDLEGRLTNQIQKKPQAKIPDAKTAGKIIPRSQIASPPIPTKNLNANLVKKAKNEQENSENIMGAINEAKKKSEKAEFFSEKSPPLMPEKEKERKKTKAL